MSHPQVSRNTFILAPMSVEAGVAAVLPMRLNADARDDLVMIGAGRSAPTVALTPSATLVVTNTTDSEPGSLRQAILDANANPDADTITFNIPGPGPHTITPATPLPPIENGSVTIDGTSEPDFDGSPVIELSGAIVGTSGDGLTIDEVGGTVVRGLVINRFNAGIRVLDASNNLIEGNYLGTDVSGSAALGNSVGVACERSGLITIGGTVAEARNLISGNRVGITGTVAAVQGNFIGTDVTGTDALGNTFRGASFDGSVEATIGGTEPGSRNIISGNGGDGASFVDSGGSLIQGNYIGLDISGTNPLGNSGNGLILTEVPHTVGGTTPAARNVISANSGHGIEMTSFGTADVLGNFIGTDNTGTRALGNGASGIMCNLSNVIGGTTAGARNVISGNGGDGITVESIENIVLGNFIGTDVTGTSALGNMGHGVQVMDIANVVGGLDDGAGNLIAFNGGDGVSVPGADRFGGILILSNSIFSNGGLGIDLLDDGVTPNDPCDADREIEFTSLQNFPVITSAVASASGVTIRGS